MRLRDLSLALFLTMMLAPAGAGVSADEDLWSKLDQGGFVLLMRHAATEPGLGDPPGFRLEDCATQRNLSAEGRVQAGKLGANLRAHKLRLGRILSSQWCRCLDTAQLVAGGEIPVRQWPALNSFFDDPADGARRTAEVLRTMNAKSGENVLLVTHQVNITALTGDLPRMGEIVVTRIEGNRLEVIGRLAPP